MQIKILNCWVITEGMIGTQNQCVGVAEALGLTPVIKTISLRQPWKSLTPWLGFESACTFIEPLNAPWPDLVIASGRKAIAASRYIKKQSGGKVFTVQIQDPKCNPSCFDLVAVPYHDNLRGENVIVTHGAPNRLTADKLNTARSEFSVLFKEFKTPRIAVLIGGNSRTHTITPEIMRDLVTQIRALKGSLMVTASRRTGAENLEILRAGLFSPPCPPVNGGVKNEKERDIFLWDGTGDNPYHGMLAWADHILVTADSVSMISDAGTTGKPVHIIPLDGNSPRFARFHQHMEEIGVSRPFTVNNTGNLESWTYDPLNDAKTIANEIKVVLIKNMTANENV